ncbi:hypothetical protein PCZ31_2383 [Clostridioides difficile]|nr:hypothetical protein PCZ31_2383 [Clostridioides difficile]
MLYLLKINQFEKSYDIGIFKNEQSIYKFIEKIPFVKKIIVILIIQITIWNLKIFLNIMK